MRGTAASKTRTFHVEIIKPSHYDDDGYVIQWMRAYIPSNSLGCLFGIADDARQRRILGDDVEIEIRAYEESHTVIPVRRIIRRIERNAGQGIVLFAGVQTNQFPRAVDLAKQFRAAGIPVVIGGFHVSGCLSMLPELPPELREAQELGISFFAGEAEGALDEVLRDAYAGRLKPIYNHLLALPDLGDQVTPYIPRNIAGRYFNFSAFDAGRGCPFRCSFCTIINVQGRKSRFRTADDVERIIRANAAQGICRFFITDDNLARNKNWEEILDRMIELREGEGIYLRLMIQVDTQAHKIPGFVEKAARAGCNRVFIGMESINPENLAAAKKYQNNIVEYRRMVQAWRRHQVLTYAGFIVGFPGDTVESIERDIETIKRELAIDILEFFVMTPLPGSADHRDMAARGEWMHPDPNLYDSEHVVSHHPRMSDEEWQAVYDRAWHQYYNPEHLERMFRRAMVSGSRGIKLQQQILVGYGSYLAEKLHPLQCGLLRRKVRTSRRPGMPRENLLVFAAKRAWGFARSAALYGGLWWKLDRMRRRIAREPLAMRYMDDSLMPMGAGEEESTGCGCSTPAEAIIPLERLLPVMSVENAA